MTPQSLPAAEAWNLAQFLKRVGFLTFAATRRTRARPTRCATPPIACELPWPTPGMRRDEQPHPAVAGSRCDAGHAGRRRRTVARRPVGLNSYMDARIYSSCFRLLR